MRLGAAAEMVPAHNARESSTLAGSGHVDELLVLEDIDQNFVTDLDLTVRFRRRILASRLLLARFYGSRNGDFLHEFHGRQIVLSEVSLHRLGNALAFYEFDEPNLDRVVSVTRRILALRNHARTGLQNGDRANLTSVIEELRHADFFS